MKKKQSQQGSSHLILIISLVIVILGALGYVYWQNYGSSTHGASATHALNIEEWGLTGSYNGSVPLVYKVNGNSLRLGYDNRTDEGLGPTASIFRYKGDVQFLSISEYELGMSYFAFQNINKRDTIAEYFNKSNKDSDTQRLIGDYYYFEGSNINIAYSQCKPGSDYCSRNREANLEMSQLFESLKPI